MFRIDNSHIIINRNIIHPQQHWLYISSITNYDRSRHIYQLPHDTILPFDFRHKNRQAAKHEFQVRKCCGPSAATIFGVNHLFVIFVLASIASHHTHQVNFDVSYIETSVSAQTADRQTDRLTIPSGHTYSQQTLLYYTYSI